MFNWLKFKKKQVPEAKVAPQPPHYSPDVEKAVQTRDQVVATALKAMADTRDIIGEEKLQKLAQMILQKKMNVDDTSPAVQAKKIIAQMDKEKLRGFMKLMVQDDQTKH